MEEKVKKISSDNIRTLAQKPEIQAYIDYAIAHEDGGLIVVGWLYDPDAQVTGFSLLLDGNRSRFNRKTYGLMRLVHGTENIYLERVPRPDVVKAVLGPGGGSGEKYGFVLVLGQTGATNRLVFETADGRAVAVPISPLTDAVEISCALEVLMPHFGKTLAAGLKTVFGNTDLLSGVPQVAASAAVWQMQMKKFSAIDHVILLEGRYLLINGWALLNADELENVTLSSGKTRIDITHRIKRYMRQDLVPAYPWSAASEPLGLMCLLDEQHVSDSVMITVRARAGDQQTHECAVIHADWNSLSRLISDHQVDFSLAAIHLLGEHDPGPDSEPFKAGLSAVRRNNMHAKYGGLCMFVENTDYVFASVDRAFPLGADGLLVYGWYLEAGRKPESVKAYDEEGRAVTVQLTSLLRRDVVDAYRERLPKASPMCGFACLVPLATRAGDLRVLGFDFGDAGEIWLKIPVNRPALSGTMLAREMIDMIQEPMGMSHHLYEMFDTSLGPAIASATRNHNTGPVDVTVRQFGVPPEQVACSVIVPLYGRCDFMRYQLSHFANDPELARCDLIYVVDDPDLLDDTLTLAARYQPLFGIPFRVLWYDEIPMYCHNMPVGWASSERRWIRWRERVPSVRCSSLPMAVSSMPGCARSRMHHCPASCSILTFRWVPDGKVASNPSSRSC
jgi:hypothetical protein